MQERRKQIIERATSVIFRQGFGATSGSDILAATGVGKGNFYHYFKGKEEFGLAIIDGLSREIGGVDFDEVFSPMKPPLRRLSDFLDAVRSVCRKNDLGEPLCTLASELGATQPYADHIRAGVTALLDRIEALVAEHAMETHLSIDAPLLARAILAQINGLSIQYKLDHNVAAFEAGMSGVPNLIAPASRVGATDVSVRARDAKPISS
jgi:TetR/AcrR family transcriptional repressor of nem operon